MTLFQLTGVGLTQNGKTLLQNITATVQAGDLLVLHGPSGSGKSTLLRLLNRLADPTEGTLAFQGKPLTDYPPCQLRQRVALVFQTPIFFPGSVLANLQAIDHLNNRPLHTRQAYGAQLAEVGLEERLLDQEALTLSLGEKQRAALARALLNNPDVLLLDEPTSALDEANRLRLLEAITRLPAQGKTVIMVNHQTDEALPLATRRWKITQGHLIEEPCP